MLPFRILIYENDLVTTRLLAGVAKELGMEVLEAKNQEQASDAFSQTFCELVLLNINLPPINIPAQSRVVTYGTPDGRSAGENLRLNPAGIITLPLRPAVVHYVLRKASGLRPASHATPSLFIELSALLAERVFRLKSWLALPEYHLDFSAFPLRYCGIHCPFAVPAVSVPPEQQDIFTPLGVTSDRGHLVCRYKNQCRLFSLSAFLDEKGLSCRLPAARILNSSVTTSLTGKNLPDLLSATANHYRSQYEAFIQARHALCQRDCRAKDAPANPPRKCCDFGCVLESYLNLMPPKNVLPNGQALIYDLDTPDSKALTFLCREFGMTPLITRQSAEAVHLMSTTDIKYVFINPDLERIDVPRHIRVVIMDELSIKLIARIISYHPVGIIPKPLDIATMSIAFTKALNIPFTQESFVALTNNLEIELNTVALNLNRLALTEPFQRPLNESARFFCENHCSFAVTKSSLDPKQSGKYHLLNPFSNRGALYCADKPSCSLWKMLTSAEFMSDKDIQTSPSEFIKDPTRQTSSVTILDQLELAANSAYARAERLERMRRGFCLHQCTHKKSDLKISRGDTLFSSMDEIMTSNTFNYCQQHACPASLFFSYFKKTMV